MSTTPPPPARLHTPPTPLHGSRYDNYEPYSPPRRSARVSSMRMRLSSPTAKPASSSLPSMPTSTPRRTGLQRTASSQTSQTLSPPSSPELSELKRATPATTSSVRRSLFNPPHRQSTEHNQSSELIDSTTRPSPAMLPTPSKTPRKQPSTTMATARILNFKPGGLETVMPTPRKQRKSRLTLDDDDAPEPLEIAVFTDPQDRVPEVDHSEDNPFIGSRVKRSAKSKSAKKSSNSIDDEEARMEEAVRNDEGVMFVFRGKKMFRPFSSTSRDSHDNASTSLEHNSLKRKAGINTQRPLTRSSLKPRLLWPAKEEPDNHDEDEEADTDIEQEHMPHSLPKSAQDLITPVSKKVAQSNYVLTPPSTHRASRSASKKLSFLSTFDTIQESDEAGPASPAATPASKPGPKMTTHLDSWQRTKPGHKRAASPTPEVGRKRARAAPAERA